jgi:hypothetical protein
MANKVSEEQKKLESAHEDGVIQFPASAAPLIDEEQQRRVKKEAERLCNLTAEDRAYQLASPHRYESMGSAIGMEPAAIVKALKAVTSAILAERKKTEKAETHKEKQRDKDRRTAERTDQKREREEEKADKKAERERKQADKEAERQAERERKEAERAEKERRQAFSDLAKLPVAQHDKGLQRLAAKFGQDVAEISEEFADFLGVGGGEAATEPWSGPVDLAVLLSKLRSKIGRYVALSKSDQMTACLLWAAHTWLYDHGVPTHSPKLAATSPNPDSGKSTLIVAVSFACPRLRINVEATGPSLYRLVDRIKPTLVLDNCDDLFTRKSDLRNVIDAAWTKGAKISRQEKIGGVWVNVDFDPFTPKALSLIDKNFPAATRSRCIEIRMVPRKEDEKVEPFSHTDDAEFAVLRQKFARWALDNAAILKDAKPLMPPGLNNRAAANWRLLLAIAELAGGSWPEQAREAAEHLTRSRYRPSDGVRLLAAFKTMFAENGKQEITSEAVIVVLNRDPLDIWATYNHGGPITQRQVAVLLRDYDIEPVQLHPTKRKDFSRRGYRLEQFLDAFARFLPRDPTIQSSGKKSRRVNQRSKKQRSEKRR